MFTAQLGCHAVAITEPGWSWCVQWHFTSLSLLGYHVLELPLIRINIILISGGSYTINWETRETWALKFDLSGQVKEELIFKGQNLSRCNQTKLSWLSSLLFTTTTIFFCKIHRFSFYSRIWSSFEDLALMPAHLFCSCKLTFSKPALNAAFQFILISHN